MKLILEHNDITTAIQNYLRDVLNVDADALDTISFRVEEEGNITALVPNARPRPVETLLLPSRTTTKSTLLGPAAPTDAAPELPPPLDKKLDEFKTETTNANVDWNENSLASTDPRALGKDDLSDFNDELGRGP